MQIEETILCFSLELILLVLILAYMILALVLGLIRGRKYLKASPVEKTGREYYRHNERMNFILAGFSLTAIVLLMNIHFNAQIQTQISSILLFFSIAFTSLVLSTIFIRFRVRNIFLYLSDVLSNVGLLSIGSGFLVFFADVFAFTGSTIIFIIFVVVLFSLSLVNYFFFDKYTKHWRSEETDV